MARIKWYGPTVVLVIVVLMVMIAGPRLTQALAQTHKKAEIQLIQESLAHSSVLTQLSESFRNVGRVVEPSVVQIQVFARATRRHSRINPRDMIERFFGPNGRRRGVNPFDKHRMPSTQKNNDEQKKLDQYNPLQPVGVGSGWVFDEQGHIITNNHVITLQDHKTVADQIKVKFQDGSERTATVIGRDPATDVAVIKVDGPVLAAKRGEKNVEQGDIVFAFGSPFKFTNSMSQGIVSAKGRDIGILGQGGYENFIQTDAAINPGNSGGPLTNIYGEIIGMNTAIASRTGAFNGIGFAIPIKMVEHVVEQLLKQGKVVRGYLGVYIEDLNPKMAKTFGYDGKGVLVREPIAGSPAAKAGILAGDIITEVGGLLAETADILRDHVAEISPDTKIALKLFRNGKIISVKVTVGELPDKMAQADNGDISSPEEKINDKMMETLNKLGIETAETLTKELAKKAGVKFIPGVLVINVRSLSVAHTNGIRRGVVITHVMGETVTSLTELAKELSKHDLKKGVRIRVSARGVSAFILLELPNTTDDDNSNDKSNNDTKKE